MKSLIQRLNHKVHFNISYTDLESSVIFQIYVFPKSCIVIGEILLNYPLFRTILLLLCYENYFSYIDYMALYAAARHIYEEIQILLK